MNTLGGCRAGWMSALLAALLLVGLPECRADLILSAPQTTPACGEARAAVEARLEKSGLTPDEAHVRVREMRQDELVCLAENPDQVQVAGGAIGLGIALLAIGVIAFLVLWLIGTDKVKL